LPVLVILFAGLSGYIFLLAEADKVTQRKKEIRKEKKQV